MSEYKLLTTDELHREKDEWQQLYDECDEIEDWGTRDEAVKQLVEIAAVLRERGELWIKLTDDDLLYRYRAGMALVNSDIEEFSEDTKPSYKEWRVEIVRRGLTVPTEPTSLDEAVAYFFDNSHELDTDDDDEYWYEDEADEPYTYYQSIDMPSVVDDAMIEDGEYRADINVDELPY